MNMKNVYIRLDRNTDWFTTLWKPMCTHSNGWSKKIEQSLGRALPMKFLKR